MPNHEDSKPPGRRLKVMPRQAKAPQYGWFDGNRIISKYEDIVLDGKVVSRDLKSSSQSTGVRGKKLGDRMLILVSDYSTFGPTSKTVKVSIPAVAPLAGSTLRYDKIGVKSTFDLWKPLVWFTSRLNGLVLGVQWFFDRDKGRFFTFNSSGGQVFKFV